MKSRRGLNLILSFKACISLVGISTCPRFSSGRLLWLQRANPSATLDKKHPLLNCRKIYNILENNCQDKKKIQSEKLNSFISRAGTTLAPISLHSIGNDCLSFEIASILENASRIDSVNRISSTGYFIFPSSM